MTRTVPPPPARHVRPGHGPGAVMDGPEDRPAPQAGRARHLPPPPSGPLPDGGGAAGRRQEPAVEAGPGPAVAGRPVGRSQLQRLPVHPRFRRRWAEARRQEGLRRLRALVTVTSCLALVAAGWGVLHSSLMAVKRVEVVGAGHTGAAAVEGAAGLVRPGGGHQLMVDVGSAAAVRAVEGLPWVASVSFHRHWPWTVVVDVQERKPAALVSAAHGAWDVVDVTGRSLEQVPAGEPVPALPVVKPALGVAPGQQVVPVGPVSSSELQQMLVAASAASGLQGLSGMQLSWSGSQGLAAHVNGWPATIVLGSADQAAEKVAVLQELAGVAPLSHYSQVDLTVPGHPALTPLPNYANG